ncbi:MAG TPA: MlaD family protein [Rhizomicrobium sp.]|jgi:phospholipid/cholesterol/gamma-HCH transport system substrate-binding protein|nr:MlaD family protein [Rhizomicrobium sp.]
METKANYVAVGAFVLACVIGLVVTILWLAGAQYSQEYSYYQTFFKGPVTGLGKGTITRYNGIEVGRVTDLAFDPNDPQSVVVTLQVQPNLNIREDSLASIESQGLTGASYVEISGGTKTAPLLVAKSGQRYPIIRAKQSSLQQLEQSAPEVVAKLNVAASRLNDLLNDNNRRAVAQVLANLNLTTSTIAKRSADIDATLRNANEATANLRDASQDLKPTIANVDVTLKKYGKVADDADAFINGDGLAQLSDLIGDMRRLVANLTKFSDQLNRDPSKILFGDRRKGYEPK